MPMLDDIAGERQRLSERLAHIDAERAKLLEQVAELDAAKRVLLRLAPMKAATPRRTRRAQKAGAAKTASVPVRRSKMGRGKQQGSGETSITLGRCHIACRRNAWEQGLGRADPRLSRETIRHAGAAEPPRHGLAAPPP